MKIAKRLVFLLGSILGGVGLAALIIVWAATKAGPTEVEKWGNDFMKALKDEKYQVAYEMLADDLKKQIGSVEDFQTSLVRSGIAPKSWSWTSTRITGVNGEATMKDGTKVSVVLTYGWSEADDGKLIEYRFARQ